MTDRQRVVGYTFENMTPQAVQFLTQKFHLKSYRQATSPKDKKKGYGYIDAALVQELTTSMRIDLFYQTAECRLVPEGDGVRVILLAGNRKSIQLHVGTRYDIEEHAALQLGVDIPLKTAIPLNTDITLRLGKRLMAGAELTVHPRSFTRPSFRFTYRRNDVDVYVGGDLDYNIRYNQFQSEFVPLNFDLRHFNLQIGLRWDYLHYRDKLESETSRLATFENKHFFSYRARLSYNSEDSWYFPTRGTRFKAEYAYLTDNFTQLDGVTGMNDISADWRMSFTFGRRFTLQPMLYGRLLISNAVPVIFSNTIGGDWFGHYIEQQMPFAGIGGMEYVGKQFLAAQLQGQQRIGKSHYVLLRLAGGVQADKTTELFTNRVLFGVQAGYFYNTMFGPVGAVIGYSNHTKEPYFFLNLGHEF